MQQLRRSCAVRLLGCCDHYEASDHNTPSCTFLTSDGVNGHSFIRTRIWWQRFSVFCAIYMVGSYERMQHTYSRNAEYTINQDEPYARGLRILVYLQTLRFAAAITANQACHLLSFHAVLEILPSEFTLHRSEPNET